MRKWKILLIVAVIVLSFYSLWPSYRFYSMSSEERTRLTVEQRDKLQQNIVKLGLDLQGGMHLVLEVDDEALSDDEKKDALDRAIKIIRNRVDQFGVSEPVIQKQGSKRIIVELPGLQDADRAKGLIGQTALLELRLVRESQEVARVLKDLDMALKGVRVEGTVVDSTAAGAASAGGTNAPAESAGSAATLAQASQTETPQVAAGDSILPTIPGTEAEPEIPIEAISEDRPFTSYLYSFSLGGVVVDEKNMEKVGILLRTSQAQKAIPPSAEFLWETETKPLEGGGKGRILYLVDKKAVITGKSLTNASTRPDPDNPANLNVLFSLDREGAVKFSRVTGENIGRQLAIVLDSKIRSAPTIQTKIPTGEGRITGRFTDEEAGDLAIVLRAGALPASVSIEEERTVGPSLGRDSIDSSTKAGIYGFLAVVLFMVLYYRASGMLANAALVLNLIIVLAALARLHAALTLPGIAGFILTIGMAVDANVLIFERIKEELAKAKTVRSAIDSGYDRAFSAILDSNVTTLITTFFLWQFGTGPIKGFATTLGIGLIANVFTAILCTRVVYDLVTARRVLKKLSI
ncbi:MAG: protein translocase subunit SecD [Chitinivibrionia bacterium]|nr:protein translocase subunit SecD [Chitinivibrionia bacterium]